MNTPKHILISVYVPIAPDSSTGAISLMISGATEVKNPMPIPWQKRHIMSIGKF